MPTIAQMRVRMNSGHRRVLEAARDCQPLRTVCASDARGLATCRATLVGWGAVDGESITAIGRALLAPAGTQTIAEFREHTPAVKRDGRPGGAT